MAASTEEGPTAISEFLATAARTRFTAAAAETTSKAGVATTSIFGAAGDDTLEGNLGADRIDGGTGDDMLVYDSSPIGVVVQPMESNCERRRGGWRHHLRL